ncbi:hypothetical protein AB0M20_12875 [Actinoplanes sp. NPDC051633]|uniref:hypothetical protein n=1 Tax=Actinoplanes sp. NPDC051633 TaxID=3155670 RepID=UPI003429FBFA
MPGAGDESVGVVVDAVHAEARKWRNLSNDMAAVHTDISRLELWPSAFFFGDLAAVQGHADAYQAFHHWYVQLLAGATDEFSRIGDALDKSAHAYADSDTRASIDLKKIYGTRPEGN